jgi:outer membrane protein assembly factor BamB
MYKMQAFRDEPWGYGRWVTVLVAVGLLAGSALGADWYRWRGPEQTGVSRETNLPASWSPEGQNVLWTAKAGGMSSPIVMKGRLYALTRVGEELLENKQDGEVLRTLVAGPKTQEAVVCLDAGSGQMIWEYRMSMTQTEVPFHRVGWSNVAGDPETGRVYALGAQCWLVCLDGSTGKEIWKRQMTEEFGMISTFGGRTPSPAVDQQQVLVAGVAFGWGDHARGQHRLFAFNKHTGELNWSNGGGGIPVDAPYNTPVFAVIGGQRLAIFGAGDGGVHAFQARTGKKVWSYVASKRGINASVVVEGTKVFACHSEENLTSSAMGSVICLDVADGSPKEVWRRDGIEGGFSSPVLIDGVLYVMDNGGTLYALSTADGATAWKKRLGTIGKASVVWADGKLYIPEANGRMNILKPGAKDAQMLSRVMLTEKLGREYVIFGSVAIADGKVYLQAANTLYCIGQKSEAGSGAPSASAKAVDSPQGDEGEPGALAQLVVTPADVALRAGQKQKFQVHGFDALGRPVKGETALSWTVGQLALPTTQPGAAPTMVGNLKGSVDEQGTFTAEGADHQGGAVVAKAGAVTGVARVRVLPPLPWKFDFEKAPLDRPPLTWLGAGGKFAVRELEGGRALMKLMDFDLYYRARTNFGTPEMSNYTLTADVRVGHKVVANERHMPDAGILNSRYVLVLLGNHQRLQIHVWPWALPGDDNPIGALNKTVPLAWEPDRWYRLKLRVEPAGNKAIVRGKAWPASSAEPAEWTIQVEDELPNRSGNPGLFGHSLVASLKSEIYYDNIQVSENQP